MGRIVFVTGGTRSGKSGVSERLVASFGDQVAYIATARVVGHEMQARVTKHRERRPATWSLIEAERDLAAAVAQVEPDRRGVLLECLYTWTTNHFIELGDERAPDWADRLLALERHLLAEVDALVDAARSAPFHLVIVSTEVGSGTTPDRLRPRRFRDLVGLVNERAMLRADQALLVVAGAALDLKKLGVDVDAMARATFETPA